MLDFDVPEILHPGRTYLLTFTLQEAAGHAPDGYLYLTEGSIIVKEKQELRTDLSGNLYDVRVLTTFACTNYEVRIDD